MLYFFLCAFLLSQNLFVYFPAIDCQERRPNYVGGATENAGVENAGANRRDGKCRSRLAVWKVEPILYSDTALSYFFKIMSLDF